VVAESIKVEARCVERDGKGKRKSEWERARERELVGGMIRGGKERNGQSVCVRERGMTRARFYPGTALRIKRLPWKPVNTTTPRQPGPFYHVYSLFLTVFHSLSHRRRLFPHHQHYHPPRTRALSRELSLTAYTGTDPDNLPCPSPLWSLHHNASTARAIIPPASNSDFISAKSVPCLDPYTHSVEPILPLSLLPSSYYYISFVE